MTGKSWDRTGFPPKGAIGSSSKAIKKSFTLPSLRVLSVQVVLTVVNLSVLLVVIS
ncbi:MAG: hypothetical protein PQJ59_01210 [Spirochaetales bacterium]|nr:hypothetical protein [Spirochaetales bacterium]